MKQGEMNRHREGQRVGTELAMYQTKATGPLTPKWWGHLEPVE